ncbi:MAG TPA: hypothetical protein VGO62_00445 [Myxococcota bacterium]|jgi:hypothetical protein
MDVRTKPDGVDAKLAHLESHFDVKNATGSRPNAIALGHELAKLALTDGGLPGFKLADARVTHILERLISDEMGAVAGAVQHTFHGDVASSNSSADILRANKQSERERNA